MNLVEVIKVMFGPLDLIILGILGYFIVRGEVVERNSFGLGIILGGLIAMGSAYAQSYFGSKGVSNETKPA